MLNRLAEEPRKAVVVGLGALVAVLAMINIYVARTSVDVSPIVGTGSASTGISKAASTVLKTPLDARPVGSFTETVTRPIFNAERKPVERQQVAAAPLAGPDSLRLVGILQTGSAKRALIRAGGDAKGMWLVEGGAVSGWTVKSIGPRSVVVMNGGRDYEIVISKGASR